MGAGRFFISGDNLKKLCELPDGIQIIGVRWISTKEELMLAVEGEDIHEAGGNIISVNPITTDRQVLHEQRIKDGTNTVREPNLSERSPGRRELQRLQEEIKE